MQYVDYRTVFQIKELAIITTEQLPLSKESHLENQLYASFFL